MIGKVVETMLKSLSTFALLEFLAFAVYVELRNISAALLQALHDIIIALSDHISKAVRIPCADVEHWSRTTKETVLSISSHNGDDWRMRGCC